MYAQELAAHYRDVRARLWPVVADEIEIGLDPLCIETDPQRREVFHLMDARKFYGSPLVFRNPGTVGRIIQSVCAAFDMTADELWTPSHGKRYVNPRCIVWLLAFDLAGLSKSAISKIGPREFDHTTIISGIRRMRRLIFDDENMRALHDKAVTVLDFHSGPKRLRFVLDDAHDL